MYKKKNGHILRTRGGDWCLPALPAPKEPSKVGHGSRLEHL